MVAMPLGQAVSDTVVYLIKAEEVTFEEEKITIVGSARIKMVVVKDNHDSAYRGPQIWGRPAAWVFSKADKAAFVIHKPKPPIISNENLRPKNYEEGIPLTAFWVENIEAEYKRLKDLGVEFRSEAMDYGLSTAAILDDTCGNLIMIYQENKK